MYAHEERLLTSQSAAETEKLGAEIGSHVRGGEVIELVSDLGGGKTTFMRGLVRGAGSGDKVASPTFTISREYKAKNLTIYHFDFYRLQEAGIVADELREVIGRPDAVVVLEWGGIVEHDLPDERLTLTFKVTGDTSRTIAISCPKPLAYLLPAGATS